MMTRRPLPVVAGVILAGVLGALSLAPSRRPAADALPARLADQEYWRLVSDFSEPNGFFQSDNLLSNEQYLQFVIPDLARTTKPGRVYMGVGPEQNFTYIAAMKPKMVFIVDVRRGNLDLHLMYKALFELSADRAEFLSRLFSKKRPEGLSAKSTASEIIAGYWDAGNATSEALYKSNLNAIYKQLETKHGFALSVDDREGIEYVYHAFFWYGPGLQYRSTTSNGANGGFGGRFSNQPSYADLMVATDAAGEMRGYLSSEERFAFLKDLETRNLLVPVVGNFAGPKAIRLVGKYLRDKAATVSAFYLSNVEQYLNQQGLWRDFCANVATLPLDDTSTFIRAVRGGRYGPGFGLNSELGNMASEVKSCGAAAGH
jgi:hypothetical protein